MLITSSTKEMLHTTLTVCPWERFCKDGFKINGTPSRPKMKLYKSKTFKTALE
jgi:hypothetical protein